MAKKHEVNECCVPRPTNSVKKITKLANIELIISLFGESNDSCNTPLCRSEDSEQGVGLCTEHYGALHKHESS